MGLTAATILGSATMATAGEATGEDRWRAALTLDSRRQCVAGSEADLAAAIRRGADLRIYTEFVYNEHVDPESDNGELVQEVSEFHVTYLLDNRWTAGIMTLRQPAAPPGGFGSRPSMSFFMYNQNGQQAIARPYLDGVQPTGEPGPSPLPDTRAMPKMHMQDNWDVDTNATCGNFIYDFEKFITTVPSRIRIFFGSYCNLRGYVAK